MAGRGKQSERKTEMKCSELPLVSFPALGKMRSLPKASNCILLVFLCGAEDTPAYEKCHQPLLLFHSNAHSAQH